MTGGNLAAFVRRNLPSAKPQLWGNLPRALSRKILTALATSIGGDWMDRPRVTSLVDERLRMEVVPRDQIGRAIYFYGMFELATTYLVRACLLPGDVFLDIGANSGYFTVIAGSLVGPTGEVHCFEPADGMRARLARNVALNGLDNCRVRAEAVWSHAGEVPFFETNVPDNSGCSSVLPGPGRTTAPRLLPSTTLDEIARQVGRTVDLVKIDVEGGELAVLEGGRHFLGGPKAPAIVFESYEIASPLALLERLGYDLRRVAFSREQGLHFPDPSAGHEDLFASYEAPNFFAIKRGWRYGSFDDVRARARGRPASGR